MPGGHAMLSSARSGSCSLSANPTLQKKCGRRDSSALCLLWGSAQRAGRGLGGSCLAPGW